LQISIRRKVTNWPDCQLFAFDADKVWVYDGEYYLRFLVPGGESVLNFPVWLGKALPYRVSREFS